MVALTPEDVGLGPLFWQIRDAAGGAECARIIRRLLEITEVSAIDWASTGHTTIDVSPPHPKTTA